MKYLLIFLLLFSSLYAEPLKVSTIPYVQSNPDIPHIALNGLPTHLQAIVEGGNCASYSYRWDVNGDGDFDDASETSISITGNPFFAPLHLSYQYPNVLGNTYIYPKVEVSCGNEIASAIMPVLIHVDRICNNYYNDPLNANCNANDGNLNLTRQIYSSRAVDIALWYLFRQAIHKANDSLGHNEHLCYVPGNQTLYSTGMALNAFLRRGHGFGLNKDNDPYYRHLTQCGLHSILSTMQLKNIGFTDTDVLGNAGKGMEFVALNNLNAFFWSSYESTAWSEPLANFGNSSYISPVGRQGIFGVDLKNIGQDIIDGLLQCTTSDGAWFYTCSNLAGATDDASTNGWAPEAIRILKRKFNNVDYETFKTKQRDWLSLYCPNGICYYDGNGNGKLAGNTLVGYGWTENEDLNTNAQVNNSINAIQSWYLTDSNHWGLYYIYASTKGLRSFSPEITYLPNGIHWSNEFTDFFITGKNPNKNSNGSSKQQTNGTWTWTGNWLWSGSFSTNERTSVITQIIQSWLEVQPYAKATPQLISPNNTVTFDHSWSYVLDPEVSITTFKWNVIDHIDHTLPDCSINEINNCNEDINKNFIVDENETIWDFTTNDINEKFTYTYTNNVDWGQTLKQKVTLRTIDNLNRIVDDVDAVSISISKYNHAPVPITEIFTGYTGQTLTLNANSSYDADVNQDPFGNHPRDFISSVEFDSNLDGVFTQQEASYVLPSNLSKISIPFKICDDGQWTDSCLDGVEKTDCSLCSFGSVIVNILPNTQPPVIVETVSNNLIDLNQSFDPENLNVSYQVEVVSGQGSFNEIATGVYEYIPVGDGYRIDTIKVTATDSGGLVSTKSIYVEVPNIPPVIESLLVEHRNLSPIISSVEIEKQGNGFYEIQIYAEPNPMIEVKGIATITDFDPFITATFNDNIVVDTPPFITPYIVSLNTGIFTVSAFDGSDTSSLYSQAYSFNKANSLSYTIDINDSAYVEVVNSSLNTYTFKATSDETSVRIIVKDNLGLEREYQVNLNTFNQAPLVLDVDVTQNTNTITVFVNATDMDNDSLQYVFNAGDGSSSITNNTGIFVYTYTSYGSFTPSVSVMDSRGSQSQQILETLNFMENQAPMINSITNLIGYAGKCWLIVDAKDPNNDELSYIVEVNGNTYTQLDFDLPYRTEPYPALITVKDTNGLSTSRITEIIIPDAPTILNMNKHLLAGGSYLIVVNATDPDTSVLKYYWKVNADQEYEERTNLEIFDLDVNQQHTLYLKVKDTWSNVETEISIVIEPQPTPLISDVDVEIGAGGLVNLRVISDTLFLNYEVDWNDGVVNNSLEHKYEWKETPYIVKIKGFTSNRQSEIFTKEIQVVNHPTEVNDVRVWQDDGVLTLNVMANDIDVDDLLYTIDFENDGVFERERSWSGNQIYEAHRAGVMPVKILIHDEWSNTTTEIIKQVDVEAWLLTVDNIQSEEGRCVVLSATEIDNPKVNLENCNLETDETSDYLWLLENEVDKHGEEVSYLFEDDGIYTIKMISPFGYYNKIRVHVTNTAPVFISLPDTIAYAGRIYKYDIQVKDQGKFDLIEVKLGAGSPTEMTIEQIDENLFRLEWRVASNLAGTEASVNLIALDYQGSDDHYLYDGGRTEQSFRIRVLSDNNLNVQENDMSIENDMPVDKDIDMLLDQMIKDMKVQPLDDMYPIMYEDKGTTKKTKFQGGSCQNIDHTANLLFMLMILVLFTRRYFKNQ